jgi:hypothetical protein
LVNTGRTEVMALLDHFASLVGDKSEPARFAERALEMVSLLTGGRAAATFRIEDGQPRLFASRGIDQDALDTVALAWARCRESLERHETVYVPERQTDCRIPDEARGNVPTSFAVVPIESTARALLGLLYVDSRVAHFLDASGLAELPKLGRILALPLAAANGGAPLAAGKHVTPAAANTEKDRLVSLLNANQWNILRVAKMIGVTRRTIYLRMQRWGIERKKPRKTLRPILAV